MRIAKATQAGRHRQAQALQWLLTHSKAAKLLAVYKVTTNRGAKTPGVDNITWRTDRQKLQAAINLKRHGYRPRPLRRHYIPKPNGKLRPLSIPTLHDRAMQALYALALAPIAETLADKNSYGFREGRRCADALEQCFICLGRKTSAQWVLEGDIKACFDEISHGWLLQHVPMDKQMLKAWLKAGYWERNQLFPTEAGTPQGGLISPLLANIALDGMEATVKAVGSLVVFGVFAWFVMRYFVLQHERLIADHKQARDSYQESLRGVVAEQSAANAKLIVCLDNNTKVLEECRDELRLVRMERKQV